MSKAAEEDSCQVKSGLLQTLSESQSKPESKNRWDSKAWWCWHQRAGQQSETTILPISPAKHCLASASVKISLKTGVDSAFLPLKIKWHSRDLHDFQEWPLHNFEPCNPNPSNSCHGLYGHPKSDLHLGYHLKLSSPYSEGSFSPSLRPSYIPSTHSRSLYRLFGVPTVFFLHCETYFRVSSSSMKSSAGLP